MKKVPTDIEKFAAKVADKQDNPTIHELAKAFPEKTYKELERYRDEDRQQEAGICVVGEARKDREDAAVKHYEDANYRQHDPDGVKVGIGHNETIWFRNECKRLVKERDEAQDSLANALEVNESHRKLNGRLQVRITELEKDNKKLAHEVEDRVHKMRKSGL